MLATGADIAYDYASPPAVIAAGGRRPAEVPVHKSRPTQNKRARERARQEKQQQKAARRLEAKAQRANTPDGPAGVDPDIAGIVPGPQPNPWGDEIEVDVEEVSKE